MNRRLCAFLLCLLFPASCACQKQEPPLSGASSGDPTASAPADRQTATTAPSSTLQPAESTASSGSTSTPAQTPPPSATTADTATTVATPPTTTTATPVGPHPAEYVYTAFHNYLGYGCADPYVVGHDGRWYFCYSTGSTVQVKKMDSPTEISKLGADTVFRPPSGTAYSTDLWAPELHYIRGEWYIYVTARSAGGKDDHRMHVLKGTSQDPTAPFAYAGTLTAPWSIDGTVLEHRGELYFLWAGTHDGGGERLYIAHMASPTRLDSGYVCISSPTYGWEQAGAKINEAPAVLKRGGKVYVVYSASDSATAGYCLGLLTLAGTDPLSAASWVKSSEPILVSGKDAYGPGHCTFIEDAEGTVWAVYHAKKSAAKGWADRHGRMQPVSFTTDGVPYFEGGTAAAADVAYYFALSKR